MCQTSAAVPDTTGAAKLVPSKGSGVPTMVCTFPRTSTCPSTGPPGAYTSTQCVGALYCAGTRPWSPEFVFAALAPALVPAAASALDPAPATTNSCALGATAPTASTESRLEGNVGAPSGHWPVLPVEATTNTPAFSARPIASRNSVVSSQATIEILMTFTRAFSARSIA